MPLVTWIRLPTLKGITGVDRLVQSRSFSKDDCEVLSDGLLIGMFQSFGSKKTGFQVERDI